MPALGRDFANCDWDRWQEESIRSCEYRDLQSLARMKGEQLLEEL